MPDQYDYQNEQYQQQATEDTQNILYFIWKGITKLPKAIYNIVWNFFWRYLKT